MPVQWSGLGPELLVRLDRDAPDPLRAQLERELREAIRAGRLAPGERLPSSRALARELGVSRGLVQECYAQLQAEGYLSAAPGSATRVAAVAQGGSEPSPSPVSRPPRLMVDFRPGRPDLTTFPRRDWMWALREVSRSAPVEALDCGDPRGSDRLREVLAAYLRRVRGAVVDAGRVVICTGFAQGVTLVFRALASAGVHEVAVEDPGDVDEQAVARSAGLKVVAVPVDGQGVVIEALAATSARASHPPTKRRPAGCSARDAVGRWSTGPASGARRSSRTTTTPSSGMTVIPSARSRAWRRSRWH
jgi:GntR family transcriptional regulator / MocR family aminotransferase